MADEKKEPTKPEIPLSPEADDSKARKKGNKTKEEKGRGKGGGGFFTLTPRGKVIFKVFLFFSALLLLDFLMVRPAGDYLKRLDETIKEKEGLIPKRLLILKHKDRILREYESLKPLFIEPTVTQEEETAQFLREIEKVSKETNFFVTNINPVKIKKKSDAIYESNIDVQGKGGLKEVLRFMETLESANPSIAVSAFNLKPQSKEGDELKVSFSITKLSIRKKQAPVT